MAIENELLIEWLEKISLDGVNLTDYEESFVSDMQLKIEQYGDRAVFTDRQANLIERIYSNRVP